jgi:glycosyltransferase involved in cell wall biosynthesis
VKIALYHDLTSGGSKRELFEFTREFARRGFTVDLYRPSTANEDFLPLAPYVRKDRVFSAHQFERMSARLPGMRNHINVYRTCQALKQTDHLARTIAAEIDQQDYAFVFLHHDRLVQSPFISRHLSTPTAYFCAEPMRRFYEPKIVRDSTVDRRWMTRLANLWYRPSQDALDRRIKHADQTNLAAVDVILTNSHYSNETIYRAYGRRAAVIHLGVDTDKFKPGESTPENRYILTVGAVAPLKGYDFLIKSVGQLPADQRYPIVIVGNTASTREVEYLKKLARDADVSIDFRVNVPEDELVVLYQQAWIYAYTPVMEPMGLSPLEALACGTPVAAVSEGGVRETMRSPGNAFLSERYESAFAEAMAKVDERRQAGSFSATEASDYIRRYWTWPHACERLFSALERTQLIRRSKI